MAEGGMAQIAVHANEHIAPGGAEAFEHGRTQSALTGSNDHPNPVESQRFDRLDAAVPGIVVDKDHFEIVRGSPVLTLAIRSMISGIFSTSR